VAWVYKYPLILSGFVVIFRKSTLALALRIPMSPCCIQPGRKRLQTIRPRRPVIRSTSNRPLTFERYLHLKPDANLCGRFIQHHFPPQYGTVHPSLETHLSTYITSVLLSAPFNDTILFGALYLLFRLRARLAATMPNLPSSGRRLFLTALILSTKILCERTFRMEKWVRISGGAFPQAELIKMERQMIAALDWDLHIDLDCLVRFGRDVKAMFSGPGPYRDALLPVPKTSQLSNLTRGRDRELFCRQPLDVSHYESLVV
jgi:hypothetical protein